MEMTMQIFLLTLNDGSSAMISALLDPDRHTFDFLRGYLAELLSKNCGRKMPAIVNIEIGD